MHIKYSNLSPMTNDQRTMGRGARSIHHPLAILRRVDITPATRLESSPGRINLRTDESLAARWY